jgi:hypothetical protein
LFWEVQLVIVSNILCVECVDCVATAIASAADREFSPAPQSAGYSTYTLRQMALIEISNRLPLFGR